MKMGGERAAGAGRIRQRGASAHGRSAGEASPLLQTLLRRPRGASCGPAEKRRDGRRSRSKNASGWCRCCARRWCVPPAAAAVSGQSVVDGGWWRRRALDSLTCSSTAAWSSSDCERSAGGRQGQRSMPPEACCESSLSMDRPIVLLLAAFCLVAHRSMAPRRRLPCWRRSDY